MSSSNWQQIRVVNDTKTRVNLNNKPALKRFSDSRKKMTNLKKPRIATVSAVHMAQNTDRTELILLFEKLSFGIFLDIKYKT